jgi:hypothetical protein
MARTQLPSTSYLAFRLTLDGLDLEEFLLLFDIGFHSQSFFDLVGEQQHGRSIYYESNADYATGLGR